MMRKTLELFSNNCRIIGVYVFHFRNARNVGQCVRPSATIKTKTAHTLCYRLKDNGEKIYNPLHYVIWIVSF